MNRKDYRIVAATLARQHTNAVTNDPSGKESFTVETVIYALADTFAESNALFDRVKFLRAVFHPSLSVTP
jgi:hypothetical protein